MNPLIAKAIRDGIRELDRLGAEDFADYWVDELHEIDGYPIEHRWNATTLAKIQSDIAQASIEQDRSMS